MTSFLTALSGSQQVGKTKRCVSHGGGKRCDEPGCDKAARPGAIKKCKAHGGGRRCDHPEGCGKSAKFGGKCIAHGGGYRCKEPGCDKSARPGPTSRCKAHGGEERPSWPPARKRRVVGCCGGCGRYSATPPVAQPSSSWLAFFARLSVFPGGDRCEEEGCGKAVSGGQGFPSCQRVYAAHLSHIWRALFSSCLWLGTVRACQALQGPRGWKTLRRAQLYKERGECWLLAPCAHAPCPALTSLAPRWPPQEDGTTKCMRHGGGKRCGDPSCSKGAVGGTGKCRTHGIGMDASMPSLALP